jgi:hypothetical protein
MIDRKYNTKKSKKWPAELTSQILNNLYIVPDCGVKVDSIINSKN